MLKPVFFGVTPRLCRREPQQGSIPELLHEESGKKGYSNFLGFLYPYPAPELRVLGRIPSEADPETACVC